MLNREGKPVIAIAGDKEIVIEPAMINRHGLVAGATGTGKTVSLQSMAEGFSQLGIPVFMADVKGDLSGLAKAGTGEGKPGARVKELGLVKKGYQTRAFPVCFWAVGGKSGHPLRATISDLGPILLSRLLGLNDTQSGVLSLVFKIADDNGLLLLDLKDLRQMCAHVGEERANYRQKYGQMSPATIGSIQRALLRLEEEGGDEFFGEPALDVMDLLRVENGLGVINILDATKLINTPGLYSCVLLWLLSELFERLPEAGDAKSKLVFFFDEAHLLFDGIQPALLQKIEQVARLIRSRGVGIYFVSQNPSDIPDAVLGQMGNRVQHALRAFTPKDQKAVRAAAEAFRPNPAFFTQEAISNLGVGEALVSFMDENGVPAMVEKVLIVPPQSLIGPISQEERVKVMAQSPLGRIYEKTIDRESAYEILTARALKSQQAAEMEAERQKAVKSAAKPAARTSRASKETSLGDIFGNVAKQASSAAGRELGKALLRGLMGSLFGGKR